MIATFACLAILIQGESRSLIQQIGVPVDVENGYFDYLQAAEIIRTPEASAYMQAAQSPQWAGILLARADGKLKIQQSEIESKDNPLPALTPESIAVARRVVNMTPLEVKRETKEKLKSILRILEIARSKKSWDPRKFLGFETLYPEYTHFRELGRFLNLVVVDAEFSIGNGRAATQAILDGFRVGEICETGGTLIGVLVSKACQAVSMRSVEKNLARFSIPDCKAIENYATENLKQPSSFGAAVKSEKDVMMRFLDNLFTDGETAQTIGDSLTEELKKVPESQRGQIIADAKREYNAAAAEVVGLFDKTERDWAIFVDARASRQSSEAPTQPTLSSLISGSLTPSYDQVISASLLRRIQVRLLRAAMVVMQYRWTNDKLPERLAGIANDEIIRDPITGGLLQYRPKGNSFELIGTGARAMGEIRLLYRVPPSASTTMPPL